MSVGSFGKADLARGSRNSFPVNGEKIRALNLASSVGVLKVIQAQFDVILTATGNNVLTVFFVRIFAVGSNFASFFRPCTSLGKSAGFLGSTETRTTGAREYFMVLIQDELSLSLIVPVVIRC